MGQHYHHLSASERNFIQSHLNVKRSCRWIAGALGRSVSAVSREVRRSRSEAGAYDAVSAATDARARRRRGPVKLRDGSALRGHVFGQIRKGWSPQQISGRLKQMPECEQVSHETIYQAIYVLPRGELRKEIIGLLRQGRKLRRPRSQGKDRRGGLIGMVSIHERPEHVLTREVFGDWALRPTQGRLYQRRRKRQRHRHAGGTQKPLHDPGQNEELRRGRGAVGL
jgi:transposase, IS30 family